MASSKPQDPVQALDDYLHTGLFCTFFNQLPSFIKNRTNALKNLQIEHIKLESEFHKEVYALEMKYAKLYQPLWQKRYEIVSGLREPSEKESKLPEGVVDYNDEDDIENRDMVPDDMKPPKLTEEQENIAKEKLKGLPGFWLGVMMNCGNFADAIEDKDREILKYLSDVRVQYGEKASDGFVLEFHFNENPFFTNKVLTKKYILNDEPDKADPFSFEGTYVIKSEGCTINWNDGKDPTKKTVKRRQRHKTKGNVREVSKEVECDSFFHFFKPPTIPDKEGELDDETSALAAIDFELGELIRHSIIPNATLYYTRYLDDEDDDEDDDDEDGDDDDDMDDEDDSDSLGEEN